MCFDISLLFGNKPLFVQLSTNKFGRLLTAHQHTAKDRPHAETTTYPIGSHTRNEQSRIDFLRIFYGCNRRKYEGNLSGTVRFWYGCQWGKW